VAKQLERPYQDARKRKKPVSTPQGICPRCEASGICQPGFWLSCRLTLTGSLCHLGERVPTNNLKTPCQA
jgi:hypothetical protein